MSALLVRKRRLAFESLENRHLLAAQISELLVDPLFGNSDTTQMVELRGAPNSVLADGTYLAIVSERGPNEGEVHGIFDLGGQSFGANGYLVLLQQDSPHVPESGANVLQSTEPGFGELPEDIYNDSHSLSDRIDFNIGANAYMLIQTDVAPVLDQDIDADDNGIIDPAVDSAWDILDSISLHPFVGRGEIAYGNVVFAEIGSSQAEITVPDGVEVVHTEGFGYAGRVGESTGSNPDAWVVGTVQDENSGSADPPQWALVDNLFGTPSQYAFSGRDLDHVGGPNFVGGIHGFVQSDGSPAGGVMVLADVNDNGTRDSLTHVVDPDDAVDPENPSDNEGFPLLNAYPGVTVTNFALDSFAASKVTAERESDFPDKLENRIFAKGGIDWFSNGGVLRFDFYRPVSSVSITAIGNDNALSKVYGRIDAFNAEGELIGTDLSSELVDSQRESISVSSNQEDIAYLFAYADETVEEGGPFGRFDRLVYSQREPAAITEPDGRYEIRHLFPGEYTLKVPGSQSGGEAPPIEIEKYEHVVQNFSVETSQPPSVADAQWSVPENRSAGTVIGTVNASDPNGDVLRYRIDNAETHGLIIDEATGVISAEDDDNLDFESNAQFELSVTVTDAFGASDSATITIDVTDLNETPVLEPHTFRVSETTATAAVVGTVRAEDPDQNQTVSYEITGGNGASLFAIDGETGQLRLESTLDFETQSQWTIEVRVSDNHDEPLSTLGTVTVTVDDVNEAPQFQHEFLPPDVMTGEAFVFDLPVDAVIDPEGDPWTLVASRPNGALPTWLRFDHDGMSFRGVPTSMATGPIQVTLRAFNNDNPGVFSAATFEFLVNLSETPLHNTSLPHDVSGDDRVMALDALRIINFLNREGGDYEVDQSARFEGFYDVSGDNLVTAVDALRVINEISRLAANPAAGEAVTATEAEFLPSRWEDSDRLRRTQDTALEHYLAEATLY